MIFNPNYKEVEEPDTSDNKYKLNDINKKINKLLDKVGVDHTTNENAMNAINPVVSYNTPFILKASPLKNTFASTTYALSPDLISDKYLAVDENNHLSIVESDYFDNYYIEEFEYLGDTLNLAKIDKAYTNQDEVDDSFIYTALSNKKLLSNDQIYYDDLFKKVDLDKYNNISESITATFESFNQQCIVSLKNDKVMNTTFKKYKNDVTLMEDVNGYFFKNKYTNKRTKSVDMIKELNTSMIESII